MSPRIAESPALAHHTQVSPANAAALCALALLLGACPTGTGGESETGETPGTANPLCLRYIDCVGVARPSDQPALADRLGESGSCWQGGILDQAACVDECSAGLGKAHLDHPSIELCNAPENLGRAVFELGEAVFEDFNPFAEPVWRPLTPGDELAMVRGGQGLLMFAIGLRGANFVIAEDPQQFSDPEMPRINMWMDIEGYNVGFGGHFARINNYPIPFRPLEGSEGIFQFLYVAVIVPDAIEEPEDLDGLPGHLWFELRPYEDAPIIRELDVIVRVEDPNI